MIDEASGDAVTEAEMLMNDMLWYADGSLPPRNMTAITGTDGAIQGKVNSIQGDCSTAHNITECCRHHITEDIEELFTWYV